MTSDPLVGLSLIGIWGIIIGLKPCGWLDAFLQRSGCVQVLSGHETDVGWIAMTPNGTLLASSGVDKTVKVWQLSNGTLLHTLNIGIDIYPLNFSADGTMLAVASRNNAIIQLWSIKNGELQHRLENVGWITDITFSPDGKILAVATTPTKLWRVSDGTLLKALDNVPEDFNSFTESVAFSSDGKMLAAGGAGTIRLWQVEGCTNLSKECGTLIGLIDAPGAIDSIAFSPQGDKLAAGSEDMTRVWQINDCLSIQKCGKLLHTFQSKPFGVYDVAFSPNGEILAENSGNRQIRVWRLSDGALLHDYNKLPGGTHNLLFTSDNSILTTAPSGNKVQVWKLDSE